MKSSWHGDETWDPSVSPDSIPMFFNVPEEYKKSNLDIVYKDLKFSNPVTAEILLKFRYDETKSSPDKEILNQKISSDNFKEMIKNHEPLLSIYDTLMIDSLIRYKLKSTNMAVSYAYAFVKAANDSVAYSSNPSLNKNILHDGIRTRLSPADLFSYPYDIILYTLNKPQSILRNITWILSLSIGIILLLLFGYIYFIRTIIKQKKISEMKNDFINNMTHEFNTPLANISLAYETLKEKGKIMQDDFSSRVVNIIESETDKLKENVIRILKISSFERNGIDLTFEKINLTELIKSAISVFELRIKQKMAIVNFNGSDEPVYFHGDRHHLSNALENLIDNSLKYCSEDCVVDIDLKKNGNEISILFTDNGIGISKDELNKIFDKFYRVQHGNIQNDRGFGLGLNYVKFITEAHGGKINVTSSPGKGSSFTIILFENER